MCVAILYIKIYGQRLLENFWEYIAAESSASESDPLGSDSNGLK